MPKPQYSYRRIGKQTRIRQQATGHKYNLTTQSRDPWQALEHALRSSRMDARRLNEIHKLINELKTGLPISRDGKRLKIYIDALEHVHDLAQLHKELSELNPQTIKHTQTILRIPRGAIERTDILHAPSLISSCLALVILIEVLLAKRKR